MRRDTLLVATAAYLLAPIVIFAAGWLRPLAAVAVVAAVAMGLFGLARRERTEQPPISRRALAGVWTLAAFWTAAGGIGGLVPRTADYLKHNLVFHDLIVQAWPVVYGAAKESAPMLCYYIGYYLPAALAGKALGLQAAAPASLLWGLAGTGLAFAWVYRLGRPHGGAVLAGFTLIDGFCWLPGLYVLAQKIGVLPGATNAEWWHSDHFTETLFWFGGQHTRLLFQSGVAALSWAPQHTLGAWLATACVLSVLLERRPPRFLLLIHAATLLWSPFVAVGLLPFTLVACLRKPRALATWSGAASAASAAAVAAPLGLFFLAHAPQQFLGWLPAAFAAPADWLRYALFLGLSVGALWAAAWWVRRRTGVPAEDRWRLLCLACLTLCALTLLHVGRNNDWVMRASQPSLVVLHLLLAAMAAGLWRSAAPLRLRLAVVALLLVSAERSVKMYIMAPFGGLAAPGKLQTTIATATLRAESLAALPSSPSFEYASQYLGSRQSVFGRYLMRRAAPPAEP